MSLRAVAPDVWTVEHPMRFPGGVHLPSRMTIVRLPGGDLWVHSPVPIDDALAAEVDALGPVAHVVAPSLYHHVFVRRTLARYPHALLSAAPGLAEKRPELPVADELEDEAPPAWQGTIDQVLLAGVPRLNELAFFHRPSGTLIVTDLVFNVREPRGLGTALVLRTMGTYRRLGQSRLWRWISRDRAALRHSVERLMTWDFTRVLPGHGEPVETDARAAMTEALWILRD